MNDAGSQLYDQDGMAGSGLLTANDVGTQLYDFNGMCEGFLGTTLGATTPLRMLMGVGI